jgi:mannose-6-phosphate isomerase-like protein (cupin superfamily)
VSDYTKLNLERDVENSAEKFGMGEILEAHFARDDLEATQFGLSLQRLKPNQRMPFGHTHNQQEEVYVIAGGSGRLKLDDEVLEVDQWDAAGGRKLTEWGPRPTGHSVWSDAPLGTP